MTRLKPGQTKTWIRCAKTSASSRSPPVSSPWAPARCSARSFSGADGDPMGAQLSKAAILVLVAAALIWIGIAFAGFALLTALTPALGLAGAAAIVAALLLLGPLGALVALLVRRPPKPAEGGNHEVLLTLLSAFARN